MSIALRVISGKWKPLILRESKGGTLRYSQLQRRIPKALRRLTSQLRQLKKKALSSGTFTPSRFRELNTR